MRQIFLEFTLPYVGSVEFPAYLTMVMVGFLVAIILAKRQAERLGIRGDAIIDLGLLMMVSGLLGARLLAVLTDGMFMDFVHLCTAPQLVDAVDAATAYCTSDAECGHDYLCNLETHGCHPPRDCLAALKFWQGGLTYYGGFLLAVPIGIYYVSRKRLGVWRIADLAAGPIMLGLFFGRFGCFFNGCCWGARTDSWLGVSIPGKGYATHATQLYEGIVAIVLYYVLTYLITPRKRAHGEVFAWLVVLYGVCRFALEFLRADPRGALGALSTSQIISIPLVIGGITVLKLLRRRPAGASMTDVLEPPSADDGNR